MEMPYEKGGGGGGGRDERAAIVAAPIVVGTVIGPGGGGGGGMAAEEAVPISGAAVAVQAGFGGDSLNALYHDLEGDHALTYESRSSSRKCRKVAGALACVMAVVLLPAAIMVATGGDEGGGSGRGSGRGTPSPGSPEILSSSDRAGASGQLPAVGVAPDRRGCSGRPGLAERRYGAGHIVG